MSEGVMSEIGAFLSNEEHDTHALLLEAKLADAAPMRSVLISGHFHPWMNAQGESPFVWGLIGAIPSASSLRVTTGVTCPTVRIHPAMATTKYLWAGFDEIYVNQIGPEQEGLFAFYGREINPRLGI
jgi:hypothetical protein